MIDTNNVSKLNVKFIRMAKTLLINDENISPYVKKRLKSMRDPQSKQILKTLTFQEFEAEFNNRKTKWLKKLKWLKKAEKIENPENPENPEKPGNPEKIETA